MCGITGVYSPTGRVARQRPLIAAMTEQLRHRGPDDAGYFEDASVSFGFRRLAIMDPERGQQPFRDDDLGLAWMVNGEIYNYPELKSWLGGRGHRFSTGSDAEIVGALYAEKGPSFVESLNGQFGLALWDRGEQMLLLARDAVGIAPLFYAPLGDGLVFGSEIKALLAHPALETGLDLKGLDQVLVFPGLVSPRTLFKGIKSVKPGHLLRVSQGEITESLFWDLVFPEESALESEGDRGENFWTKRLGEALERSVARRLQSDVPVGFYLSGGLDSALVASHIRQASQGGVQDAFSIIFADAAIDEGQYQRSIADHLGCRRHETPFDWPDIAGRLSEAVLHGETPLKESYNTCSLALSEAVRKQGIKSVLTGEGADELFAGYVGYRMDLLRQPEVCGNGFEDFLEEEIRERLWGDPAFFYERAYAPFRELRQGLYAPELRDSFPDFDATEHPVIDTETIRNRHPLHKRAYIDFKLRLSDHLLADHGDRMAFARGVEARYPFLDPEMIEIARTIPPDLLIRDGAEKYPLRSHAKGRIPQTILARQKFAFVAPGSPFLIRQKIPWIMDLLSGERIRKQGVFDAAAVNHLVRRCLEDPNYSVNTTFETDFLMIVLTFQILSQSFDRHLHL